MEFIKSDFIAEAVVARLRAGVCPNDGQVVSLDRRPLIDGMRKHILATDVPWILGIIKDGSSKLAGLGCSLARHHMNNVAVKRCLENRWSQADAYLKNRIMWRLLDIADLHARWRSVFVDFIQSEWEVFSEFNRVFFAPANDALAQVASRLTDASFPDTKKWIYLYCVPSVTAEPSLAKAVLGIGYTLADPFAQDAAKTLLLKVDGYCAAHALRRQTIAQEDFSFIADAALTTLRTGTRPADIDSDLLNRLPIIDALRVRVERTDLEWIWPIVEGESRERAGLFVSLLQRYAHEPESQVRLRSIWAKAEVLLRAHLMWRILDDPKLPLEWHEKLFEFVLSEWSMFQRISLKFLGTPETVIMQVLKRIADPSFPKSKRWAYLCRIPEGAEDQEAARALVLLGVSGGDEFMQKVGRELLQQFFTPKQAGNKAASGAS